MLYYRNNRLCILEDIEELDIGKLLEKKDLETLRMQKSFIGYDCKLFTIGTWIQF